MKNKKVATTLCMLMFIMSFCTASSMNYVKMWLPSQQKVLEYVKKFGPRLLITTGMMLSIVVYQKYFSGDFPASPSVPQTRENPYFKLEEEVETLIKRTVSALSSLIGNEPIWKLSKKTRQDISQQIDADEHSINQAIDTLYATPQLERINPQFNPLDRLGEFTGIGRLRTILERLAHSMRLILNINEIFDNTLLNSLSKTITALPAENVNSSLDDVIRDLGIFITKRLGGTITPAQAKDKEFINKFIKGSLNKIYTESIFLWEQLIKNHQFMVIHDNQYKNAKKQIENSVEVLPYLYKIYFLLERVQTLEDSTVLLIDN